jgi:hypothetical protein
MTFSPLQLDVVDVGPAGLLSDHSLVVCRLPFVVDASVKAERFVRRWRLVDGAVLRGY